LPELTPEERERIYQEEKARIEARHQIEMEKQSADAAALTKPSSLGGWLAFIALCLVVCMCIFGLGAKNNKGESAPYRESRPILDLGSEVHIDAGGTPETIVFLSKAALDESSKYAAAHDKEGYDKVVYSGQGIFVHDQTKARVIENQWGGVTQVRILDGPHKGKEAYLPTEYLK